MKPPYRPAGTSLNPLHVAEGCQPFFRGRPVGSFRGLNPLHVAEGCQPKRCASISVGNWVSIRCMSRKAVSQVTLALGEATGVSIRCMSRKAVSPYSWCINRSSHPCLNPLHVAEGCQPLLMVHQPFVAPLSQSAACRGRLSASCAGTPLSRGICKPNFQHGSQIFGVKIEQITNLLAVSLHFNHNIIEL